jgi:hypothetical protein
MGSGLDAASHSCPACLIAYTMNGEDLFFEVRHDPAGLGARLGNLGRGDEWIRVPQGGPVNRRGRAAAHLAEVVSVRFGIVKHGPGKGPVTGGKKTQAGEDSSGRRYAA